MNLTRSSAGGSAVRAFDRSLFRCCQQAVWQTFQTENLVRASTPNDPMPENSFERSSKRVLDPIDRVSEVLFGLIMVLTFTGSLSVAEAGRENIRTMLIGALGCNLAWGIIDGVLYMMGCLADKGRGLLMFHAVRKATDPKKAQHLIADSIPTVIASILEPAELETMHRRLQQLPEPPGKARLGKEDWL